MGRYLLDTGLVIRHLRGHRPSVKLLRGLAKRDRLCISTITRLEIRAGMRPSERYATQRLLSRFVNIAMDTTIADHAGEYIFKGRNSGNPIQVPDAIIAATATVHNLTLVTLNVADFHSISELRIYPL